MKNKNQVSSCSATVTAGTSAAPLLMCLPIQYITAQLAQNPPDAISAPQEDSNDLTSPDHPPKPKH